MRRAALVVLIAAVPCLTCGTVSEQVTGPAAETDSNNLATLDDLGVCGPIHEAIIRFGPKDGRGVLDAAALERGPTTVGSWMIKMQPPPPGLNVLVAGHRPDQLKLHEYVGVLQGTFFIWDGPRKERSAVWKNARKVLTTLRGEPEHPTKDGYLWYRDEPGILLGRLKEPQRVIVFVTCIPYEKQLWASQENAEAKPDNTTETASPEPDAPPGDPRLEHSIVDILRDFGQPTHAYALTEQIVCFHYTGTEGPMNAPAETWWWFFEGRGVYHATEFLPPAGSRRAQWAFRDLKDQMRRAFGAPVDERRQSSPASHRFEYADGTFHCAITLFDADGNPYFCTEFFDSTVIDKLGSDLRPDRSLPERYTPPPLDSGLTREDFGTEMAPG